MSKAPETFDETIAKFDHEYDVAKETISIHEDELLSYTCEHLRHEYLFEAIRLAKSTDQFQKILDRLVDDRNNDIRVRVLNKMKTMEIMEQ